MRYPAWTPISADLALGDLAYFDRPNEMGLTLVLLTSYYPSYLPGGSNVRVIDLDRGGREMILRWSWLQRVPDTGAP